MNSYSVIDSFCGAGGLSLGFKNAGFEIIYSHDIDQKSVQTYRYNLGDHAFVNDMYAVTKKSLSEGLKEKIENVDVIIGGPPCQGFSVQRRGSDTDSRNNLVPEFIRFVLEVRPRFFVMENVGGLLSKRGKPFISDLRRRCEKEGYFLHIEKLNAFDYGVPQIRKRVFLVGELLDGCLAEFVFPSPNKIRNTSATVREAIEDLMNKNSEMVSNHIGDRLTPINLERIRSLREGQGRDSLPDKLQLKCHTNNRSHRHLDVYGRMFWDEPSSTITARFDSFSRGRFGHPELDRTITLREGARLQSFPDSFKFFGTKVEVARQIGNAVPPLLALSLAEEITRVLSNKKYSYNVA